MTIEDTSARAVGLLERLGILRVSGDDAAGFLQSMFSADIAALEPGQSVLSAWHDPRGRALACARIVMRPDAFWLVTPRERVPELLAGLQRYVLRARVALRDASDELAVAGVITSAQRFEIYAQREPLAERVARHRAEGSDVFTSDDWELADIREGLPAVFDATAGLFTAQMLNLDLIGGVSFDKGCYPGQEIIARTHFRGRARRRMHRFVSAAAPRAPAAALFDTGGRRAGQVVRSAPSPDGSESLVVCATEGLAWLAAEDGARFERAALPYKAD